MKDPFGNIPDVSARFAGTVLETRVERHQRLMAAVTTPGRHARPEPDMYGGTLDYTDDGEPETTSQHKNHATYDENCRACAHEYTVCQQAIEGCTCEYVKMFGIWSRVVVENGECEVHDAEPPDYQVPEDPDESWPGWLSE